MLYNTGSIYNPETENSILNYKDVEAYLKSDITYELPLDFAYPTYSWGILTEERNFRVILHEVNFSDTLRYKKDDRWKLFGFARALFGKPSYP